MSRIRGKNTSPELKVRSLLNSLGFRYRLHVRKLPGVPDIVFNRKRKVIFVHGCFWHQHTRCTIAHLPKSRHNFWASKLEANCGRDKANEKKLGELGWNFLVIWECETADPSKVARRLKLFLR
jgi:DNA mismatch endonuclease, patch repair protein